MEKQYKAYEINVNTIGFYTDRLLYAMIKRQVKDLKEDNLDLQHSEFILLKVLNILGGASQTQLANVMGKERSGISRTVTALEKKGYVERRPLNGSTNYVTPSKKGAELMPRLLAISNKLSEQAFKGFSDKRRDTVMKYLDRIYNNVLIKD